MKLESPSTALLSIPDAAKYLQIDARLLRAAVEQGQVPSIAIGKRRRIALAVIEKLALGQSK